MSSAASLREEVAKRRDALSGAEREEKSEAICKNLLRLPEYREAEQVLFYVAFRTEVDTSLMREMSREAGQTVAAPRGDRNNRSMQFYAFDSDADLESGPFGILQPPPDPERLIYFDRPTLIFVPGLVFDRKGNRMGWGMGFYDRFLAGPARGQAAIGLAFDCQFEAELPSQAHDVPLQAVVSESGIFRR
jgi:5-formyltetrahydrofolate cyclo-ligase